MPCAPAVRVVSATSVESLPSSWSAWGSATVVSSAIVIPWDPAHSAATQEFMARVIIGDPDALNTGFRNGQLVAVRANLSGTTIRFAHEQANSCEPKELMPTAVPLPKLKSAE